MPLAAGSHLGPYEVLALIGAGGMGEVYLARDPRLGRDVAIKVLPHDRVADESRRQRFVQEARAASALNHPHIITIHEIQSANGIDFLVMEYVRGKSLDALIPRQGMRLGEALRIAIAVADAVECAHKHNIVHRDLKPANVMVATDGAVKVLDFGLAKLLTDDTSDSHAPTRTADAVITKRGAVVGTLAYMSPEQANGEPVDARSDVFSFGAMLYEMVTGQRAFAGKTAVDTLAAVVRDHPKPLREVVPGIPAELEHIVVRCLKKEPDRRFQHMGDVRVELQELKETFDSGPPAPAGAKTLPSTRTPRRAIMGGIGVAILSGVVVVLWRTWQPTVLSTVTVAPTLVQLTSERRAGSGSFSPDGTQIVFSSAGEHGNNWDVWLKIVGQDEARRLTADAGVDIYPAWSPDGTHIAFLRATGGSARVRFFSDAGTIHIVSPVGGLARRVSDFPARLQLSWSPDGRWLAASKARVGSDAPGGIYLISVATGEHRQVTFPKPPAFDVSPSFSPDGSRLAYASCEGVETWPVCDVQVLSIDPELRPQGTARTLTRQRNVNLGVAWTRDGRSIVYASQRALWRVREDGGAPPERQELAGDGASPSTARSRDRLAFNRRSDIPDIYQLETGGSPMPLIQSTFTDRAPQYSPDGRRIVFESERSDSTREIWLADADGSNVTRLTRGPGRQQGSPNWSPDGRVVAFDSQAEDGRKDIWTIGADGSGMRQITRNPADDYKPTWSPDGRFIYFDTNRNGRAETWRVKVIDQTEEPVTARLFESVDGRMLYYEREGVLLARPASGGRENTIRSCLGAWAVGPRGVFYECAANATDGTAQRIVSSWDAGTGKVQKIATLSDTDAIGGISVSRDGRSIIYDRSKATFDLMMIENFR